MKKVHSGNNFSKSYMRYIYTLMIIASVSISFAVIATGILGYRNTSKSIIKKAKSQDIVFIVKSMADKIDGRIERALETSYIFARDPYNIEWLESKEGDKKYDNMIMEKAARIADNYDYNMFFVISLKTNHDYFVERHNNTTRRIDKIFSVNNPADKWFFEWQKNKKKIELNVNYDSVTDSTLLFINTRMGSAENPLGICGTGLSLSGITNQFKKYKFWKKSSLLIIDDKGTVKLSDNKNNIGKNYRMFVPEKVAAGIMKQSFDSLENVKVSEYVNRSNEIMDYAYCRLSSCNWTLLYQVPRSESISILYGLKIDMMLIVLIVLFSFIIIFYIISKRLADPYRQAVLINEELEKEITIRTDELRKSNEKIIDSIKYAERLQESILPSSEDMKRLFKDSFVIWKPKDIVGGDFYWMTELDDTTVFILGDCTGHGVPGALMTMTVNAILHNIVTEVNKEDPGMILKELDVRLKEALNKKLNSQSVDDGLDAAVLCIKDKSQIIYSGAGIGLYIKNKEGIKTINPQSRGIGYSYMNVCDEIKNEIIQVNEDDIFIVHTDGFMHQNGGDKKYPFGKKRMQGMLEKTENEYLSGMKEEFQYELQMYMDGMVQRDDITMVGIKVK